MPIVIRAVRTETEYSASETKHHGGGIMMRGGFDTEEVEISIEEYASDLVKKASMDVAYRKWAAIENVTLDNRFYLFSDEKKNIVLVRVGKKETLPITGNDDWRNDARKWIAENYEDDPVSDVILAKTCIKHGESL